MKNLLKKLNQLRATIKVDKEGARYKAFTVSKLNAELNPALVKLNIGVTFSIISNEMKVITKADGKQVYTADGIVRYTLVDLDSEDKLEIDTVFTGMNSEGDPSKSQGNAHSYSYKYLWVTLLGLTDDETDPDSIYSQGVTMLQEQKTISSGKEKDKTESQALLNIYEISFPDCKNKDDVLSLVEDAKNDFPKMLTYEQNKLKKLVSEVKLKWNIN
jgi:hypothetical protein